MYKFGQEIIAADSGTICPVWVAQYGRYIQAGLGGSLVPHVRDSAWAFVAVDRGAARKSLPAGRQALPARPAGGLWLYQERCQL